MSGIGAFLREAIGSLADRRLIAPAVAMWIVLTFSNAVLLLNLPQPRQLPSAAAILAIAVRLLGLAYVGVALLRVLTRSPRPVWRPDGAFWLYLVFTLLSLAVANVLSIPLGVSKEPLAIVLRNAVTTVLLAPFAPWLAGVAAARPLGANPRRFMRDFGSWLPPLILWSLLIVTPMSVVHALIDYRLMAGVGDAFWPIALIDGTLSLAIVLLGFALNAAAYRRVAPA